MCLWPPTVISGILVIALTLIAARIYPHLRKQIRFQGKAVVKFNDESFFIRTLSTGLSLSSLLVQASNIQLSTALRGPGLGQLYITVGLLIASGVLLSNMKQKLDTFVAPTIERQA